MDHHLDSKFQPIALIGMGCRFPGGIDSPESLWHFLQTAGNAITDVADDRWSLQEYFDSKPGKKGKIYTKKGGFLDRVRGFDPGFFGLSEREACSMDPQQRLLLKTTWESLEDAGIPPEKIRGSNTGVFVGLFVHDYENLHSRSSEYSLFGPHSATGTSTTIAANRISHVFDLRGPSMVVDTACSSSLVALHLACRSLLTGESDLALAGGANAILRPEMSMLLCQAGMLSPTGACRAFDAGCDGYVRAEGVGVVALKRLEDAERDGDPIRAVIRATATNQDGGSQGMTVPSAEAQKSVIKSALEKSGVKPFSIDYVEAHGTGTPVGDPVECRAIGETYGLASGRSERCSIGSIKTNIGHTESTAGIAGLMKLVLMLEHEMLVPNLHFEEPNPRIDFERWNLEVVSSPAPWSGPRIRIGAVNSFGFGGTNAHVIVEEHRSGKKEPLPDDRPGSLVFPLSAESANSLREMASQLESFVETQPAPLADLAHTLAYHKGRHSQRAALVANSVGGLREKLKEVSRREDFLTTGCANGSAEAKREILFVYSGMGQQWPGMGRELYNEYPVFREFVERCDRELSKHTDQWTMVEALFSPDSESRMRRSHIAQPCIFAVQAGLTALFDSIGIQPKGILGHSAGEVAAFYAAEALSLEDAIHVSFLRGKLQEKLAGRGAMLAIGLSALETKTRFQDGFEGISIAAINSPASVTLSGKRNTLERIAGELEREQIFARFLPVDIPYHGPAMDEILEELRSGLVGLSPRVPTIPLVSSVTGSFVEERLADADYWCRNVREPVLFHDAFLTLVEHQSALAVELAAHPVLSTVMQETLSEAESEGDVIATLRREQDSSSSFRSAISELFRFGVEPDWAALNGPGNFLRLPAYPFEEKDYWEESAESERERLGLQVPGSGNLIGPASHPLLGGKLMGPDARWRGLISTSRMPYLLDHRVEEAVVFPGAAGIEMLFAAARDHYRSVDAITIEKLSISNPIVLSNAEDIPVETRILDRGFSIFSCSSSGQWTENFSGRLEAAEAKPIAPIDLASLRSALPVSQQSRDIYRSFSAIGLHYGPHFQRLKWLGKREGQALGEIDALVAEPSGEGIHPAVLDACFQVAATLPGEGTFLPVGADRISMHRRTSSTLFAWAQLTAMSSRTLRADLLVSDAGGEVIVSVEGLTCRRSDTSGAGGDDLEGLLHVDEWIQAPLDEFCPVRTASFFPSPRVLQEQLAPVVEKESARLHRSSYYESVRQHLDELSTQFILSSLGDLGMKFLPGETFETRDVCDRIGVVSDHLQLFERLLSILSEDGILEKSDARSWTVLRIPESEPPLRLWERRLREHPDQEIELLLLARCGAKLAQVLRGELDPLVLLFPPDCSVTEQLYRNSPTFRFYNRISREAVSRLIDSVPDERTLRVLEVGAGTGSLTSFLLPIFPAHRTEYCFTDVSLGFTKEAQGRFAQFPFVTYSTFDLEEAPGPQGFEDGSFDLIVASDALHTTTELRNSAANLRKLLAPGGQLVMTECTNSPRWFDLVFGLLEGWWKFRDHDIRESHATISCSAWESLLKEIGFETVVGLSEPVQEPLQTVIVAQASRGAGSEEEPPKPAAVNRPFAVLADSTGIWEKIMPFCDCATQIPPKGTASDSIEKREDVLLAALQQCDEGSDILLLQDLDGRGEHTDADDLQNTIVESALHNLNTLQSVAEKSWKVPPTLWWITAGANRLSEDSSISLLQSASKGLARVASSEWEDIRIRRIDLSEDPSQEEIFALIRELNSESEETEIALRGKDRFACRLIQKKPSRNAAAFQLRPARNSGPLQLVEMEERKPSAGEVSISVETAGLNFKDVARLRELIGENDGGEERDSGLGLECSGTVMECGAEVSHLRPGDRVMGLVRGGFASHVTEDARYLVKIPENLTFEEAATIPVAFLSAWYSLVTLGNLKRGETVLIHTASGGFGLAAIQLAKSRGARVLATAGSGEKRNFLRHLGIEYVGDSRSTDFAEGVRKHLADDTVDLILNTLPEDAVEKGISLLKPVRGRFVDLANLHTNYRFPLSSLKKGVRFDAFDLETVLHFEPNLVEEILEAIRGELQQGSLRPLPFQCVACNHADYAFTLLQKAQHIGKVILSFGGESVCPLSDSTRPGDVDLQDGTCLITGGLGGFGLATARWLAESGACNLVLVSRSEPSPEAERFIADLSEKGANVRVEIADVTDETRMREVIGRIKDSDTPLRGVIHAAMVLEDVSLKKMTPDQMRKVLLPKVAGAWVLDRLVRDCPLDFFVSYSSFSSVVGASDQGNYAAANAFLDSLAEDQQLRGIPGFSISWGGISSVGYVSGNAAITEYFRRQGISLVSPTQCWKTLAYVIGKKLPHRAAVSIDWDRFARFNPAIAKFPRFSLLLSHQAASVEGNDFDSELSRLPSSKPELQFEVVRRMEKVVGNLLGIPVDDLAPDIPLSELGFDSLMAVELALRIREATTVEIPRMTLLASGLDLSSLSVLVSDQLLDEDSSSGEEVESTDELETLIEELGEEDIDQLLDEMFDPAH